jgi:hypothetical protein
MNDKASARSIIENLPGGPELLAWFGHVPSFHDAEIISLHLDRSGPSTLRIHTWDATGRVDSKGFYILEKDVVVTFILEEVESLELESFSHQNVIGGLESNGIKAEASSFGMQWIQPPTPRPDLYEVVLHPCFGLSGTIRARRVSSALAPAEPVASS